VKITCEYCNTSFEYTGQSVCPNCQAQLSGNPDLERAAEQEKEAHEYAENVRKQSMEFISSVLNETKRTRRTVTRLVPVIISVIILIMFVMIIMNFISFSRFHW